MHHLRELKFVYEEEKSVWAKDMSDLLLRGKKITDKAKEQGKTYIASQEIALIEKDYKNLLLRAGAIYLDAAGNTQVQEGVGRQGFNLFRRLLNRQS